MKHLISRLLVIVTIIVATPILGFNLVLGDEITSNNTSIVCRCYPTTTFTNEYDAISIDVSQPPSTAYLFDLEDLGGSLDMTNFSLGVPYHWYYNSSWGGYMLDSYYNEIGQRFFYNPGKLRLSYTINKYDVEPGATRTFRLKYKKKTTQGGSFSSWTNGPTFTVSVGTIETSGPSGSLCTSNQSYTVSAPSGYSTTWSFSEPALVTSSSGTGATALLAGNCVSIGQGTITYTMTQTNCPTFHAYRTIKVNGPDFSDISLDVRYTDGNPVPKSGSVFMLCPYTHYHITAQNSSLCGISSLSWTLPASWSVNYQSSNMISIYTNANPGGQLTLRGQTCCTSCGSNQTLHVGYFGTYYNCGGYFMAVPNPSSEFVDLDMDPTIASAEDVLSESVISVTVTDKMGVVKFKSEVTTLPFRIETQKWLNGEYLVSILTVNKVRKDKVQDVETIKILVNH